MSNSVNNSNDSNPFGGFFMALFIIMFGIGSIPYQILGSITYENQYQRMMKEALDRGLIKECPCIHQLRWDCNVPIKYSWPREDEEDEVSIQDTP